MSETAVVMTKPKTNAILAILLAVSAPWSAVGEDSQRTARRTTPPPALARRVFKPIEEITIEPTIRRSSMPVDEAATLFSAPTPVTDTALRRDQWKGSLYEWVPPEFFFRPLLFDDQPLERYGQSTYPRCQPVLSGARAFGDFMLLPYKWTMDNPRRWVSPLGYERVGDPPVYVHQRLIPPHATQPWSVTSQRPVLIGQEEDDDEP